MDTCIAAFQRPWLIFLFGMTKMQFCSGEINEQTIRARIPPFILYGRVLWLFLYDVDGLLSMSFEIAVQ